MKRLAIHSFIGALGIALALSTGANVQAQTQGTKVGVVNMYVISKGYTRINTFKEEMKSLTKPYEDKIKEYKKGFDAYKKALEQTADAKKKAEYEKAALQFKRALEDVVTERNKKLVARTDAYVVTLYREIEDGVKRYAQSNGFHLIFYYFDPMDQPHSPQNVQRKLSAATFNFRAANPLYVAPGLDISGPVLQMLNSHYTSTGGGQK